jgi:hypothetical protein
MPDLYSPAGHRLHPGYTPPSVRRLLCERLTDPFYVLRGRRSRSMRRPDVCGAQNVQSLQLGQWQGAVVHASRLLVTGSSMKPHAGIDPRSTQFPDVHYYDYDYGNFDVWLHRSIDLGSSDTLTCSCTTCHCGGRVKRCPRSCGVKNAQHGPHSAVTVSDFPPVSRSTRSKQNQ